MTFKPAVFEKLLFPLHERVYGKIQGALDEIEKQLPGKLEEIIANFKVSAKRDTQMDTLRQGETASVTYPSLDISVIFQPTLKLIITTLHKSSKCKIDVEYNESPTLEHAGSHLTVGFYYAKTLHSFITPLEYLLGFKENIILRDGSYQLYSHTILYSNGQAVTNKEAELIGDNRCDNDVPLIRRLHDEKTYIYVGITRRTWLELYRQHCKKIRGGSKLFLHRFLRGRFININGLKHTVERAGLTEKQAMRIAEREVKKRSLNSLNPCGLNRIPGGYKGVEYVRKSALETGYKLERELNADNFESAFEDLERDYQKTFLKTYLKAYQNMTFLI